MILNSKDVTIAYRCPECGDTVFSILGVFRLSGDLIRLKCTNCGQSSLTINRSEDGKIHLSVPCIACPKPHFFTLSGTDVFSDDKRVYKLPCPYTSVDVCFIGEKDRVLKAVEESDAELLKMMEESGASDLSSIRGHEEDYEKEECDPMVEDMVSYVLQDLVADNAIHCNCPEGEGRYSHRFYKDNLVILCENCKCAREIRMSGMDDANRFLEVTSLSLK